MPREQAPQPVIPGRIPEESVSLEKLEAIPASSVLGAGDEAAGTPQALVIGNGILAREGVITSTGRRWSWLMGD